MHIQSLQVIPNPLFILFDNPLNCIVNLVSHVTEVVETLITSKDGDGFREELQMSSLVYGGPATADGNDILREVDSDDVWNVVEFGPQILS